MRIEENQAEDRIYLPKIANGKSNGIIILVESIVLTVQEREEYSD